MISLNYDKYSLFLDKSYSSNRFIKLITTDESVFERAKVSFINNEASDINAYNQKRLIAWLKHIKYSGILVESDKDPQMITNIINFINGVVSDDLEKPFSCYQKFFGDRSSSFSIRIENGIVPKTKELVFHMNSISYFGIVEFDVHQILKDTNHTKCVYDFDYILQARITEALKNINGIIGIYDNIYPIFGNATTINLNEWYRNSGLTIQNLLDMNDDDWNIVYQECNLFYKDKNK